MKTLVVGAGGGGIASALLASMRGETVTLLESHSKLGGCASWFKRGEFVFDAGATTLSGIGVNEPLGELFELLGHSPEVYVADPGITFHLTSSKIIRYYRDFDKWMEELSRHFPGLDHRPFWSKVRKVNSLGWSLLHKVQGFPPKDISGWMSLFSTREVYEISPWLFLSTEQVLKSFGLDQKDYLELINGIMIISAQASSENIPFLVGALALSYPAQTYAPKGGMKGLMDFFEEMLKLHLVDLRKRTRVKEIFQNGVALESGEKIICDRMIVNLPIWNLSRMYQGPEQNTFLREEIKNPGSWGAFTLYFGMKGEFRELYQQVHLNHPLVKNYFVSFSHPEDRSRAPEGYQAVSISTHVFADEEISKEKNTKIIMDDFVNRFDALDIKFLTGGSPRTFERYTGRWKGYVGGIPFLMGKTPFSMLGPVTSVKNLYRVGDTVFPGQGLCGVVSGALQLHRRFTL